MAYTEPELAALAKRERRKQRPQGCRLRHPNTTTPRPRQLAVTTYGATIRSPRREAKRADPLYALTPRQRRRAKRAQRW